MQNLFVLGLCFNFVLLRGNPQIYAHFLKGAKKLILLEFLVRFDAVTDNHPLFDIDLSQFHP